MKHIALLIGLVAVSISGVAWADSPLTSTSFSTHYQDVPEVKLASNGVITKPIALFLASHTAPLDQKIAVVNALSWSTDGKANAELFSGLLFGKGPKELVKDTLDGELMLVLGYMMALDDYFDVKDAKAFVDAAKARLAPMKSLTVAMVSALVDGQEALHAKTWCKVWQLASSAASDPTLQKDLRPQAVQVIMDYMKLYQDDCKGGAK